ncbi:MAG: hypothetical protein ACKOGG_03270, partial [Actinomycetota bacterium]
MKTIRLTTAQALVKFLVAQRIVIDGQKEKLFPGVMAIFGHGNVTSLGVALDENREHIRTYRGQNEQRMALAAVGFAKARRRQQIMVASSSIGPGASPWQSQPPLVPFPARFDPEMCGCFRDFHPTRLPGS